MNLEILRAENLTKEFPSGEGRVTVLNGIKLTIYETECIAIVGPSGSGKSTLLGLLSGLDSPTRGRVFMTGRDLNLLSETDLAEVRLNRIGFFFQNCRFLIFQRFYRVVFLSILQ